MHLRYHVVLVAALILIAPGSAGAQWLYVGYAGECVVDMDASIARGPYTAFLHAPDQGSANAVQFRLVIPDLGAEDEIVIAPEAGVFVSGDVLTGATVAFTPRELYHAPLFSINFVDHAPLVDPFPSTPIFISVRDALLHAGGSPLSMDDMDIYRVHCYGGGIFDFRSPDFPNAQIGRTTMVAFQAISGNDYWGPSLTNMLASDTRGWVVSMSTNGLWNYGCGMCPWFWETIYLTVTVPEGVAPNTTTTVTISEGAYPLTNFTLTAIEPTAVESKTWGGIKALYR